MPGMLMSAITTLTGTSLKSCRLVVGILGLDDAEPEIHQVDLDDVADSRAVIHHQDVVTHTHGSSRRGHARAPAANDETLACPLRTGRKLAPSIPPAGRWRQAQFPWRYSSRSRTGRRRAPRPARRCGPPGVRQWRDSPRPRGPALPWWKASSRTSSAQAVRRHASWLFLALQPSGACLPQPCSRALKPGIPLAAMVASGPGGQRVDPDALGAQVPGEVAHGGLERRLAHPHPVVDGPGRGAVVEVQRHDGAAAASSAGPPPRPAP